MSIDRIGLTCALAACAIVTTGSLAHASPITFMAASGQRTVLATFDASGNELVVTLINASTVDVRIPIDTLTALFSDVDVSPSLVLSPVSAVLGSRSSLLFGGTDPGDVVGGEGTYIGGLTGAPDERENEYGIRSIGLGLLGGGDRFPGSNHQGPDPPGGWQYDTNLDDPRVPEPATVILLSLVGARLLRRQIPRRDAARR